MNQIISIDETSIDTHIEHNYGWSKSGKRIIITKSNTRIRYTIITATGYDSILHYKIIKGSCNGETFVTFIKELINKLSRAIEWNIIIDNARIHHYCKFKKYIAKIDNTKIIYNIPYSPETNPIEKVFNDVKKYLKDRRINNLNIIKEIIKSFSTIKKQNINEYFNNSINFYN